MKRLFAALLCLVLLAGVLPSQAAAQDTSLKISPELIAELPVMNSDPAPQLQTPLFSGIAAIDALDNEYEEVEPNDTAAEANWIDHDYTVYGSLSGSDIYDVYTITVTCDTQIVLASSATTQSFLWILYDDYGEGLAVSEDLGIFDGYYGDGLAGTLTAGTYYFVALDENGSDAEYVFYFEMHEHAYTSVVTEPTCIDAGYTTYSCDCGFFYTDDTVPATGHSYADDTDLVCDICGFTRNPEQDGDDSSDTLVIPFTEWEWEVLKLVNKERMAAGLDPVTGFPGLQDAAAIRAAELTQLFSHTRPDGTDCFTVLDELALDHYGAGENIASGYTSPAGVMNGWMNSEGHRANILTESFAHLGVGEINFNWVQMFLGTRGEYTSLTVIPEETEVLTGTTIDSMDLLAVLESSVYGECYLPVEAVWCSGYDPAVKGTQTVYIYVLGLSNSFDVCVTDHYHNWTDADCTTPSTCTVCEETRGEPLGHSWKDATCTAPKTCTVCGSREGQALGHEFEDEICIRCGRDEHSVPIYRLYNPYTHEHLLTSGEEERDNLLSVGWTLDGVAWNAPTEGIPVYRLYNPYDDWHTYTTSVAERDTMIQAGWTLDGAVSFGAEEAVGKPIYRLFNPYEQTNYHLFTASIEERDLLVSAGWVLEGVAWYAVP